MKPAKSRDFHVLLLAGGSGTRFWPLSRSRRPKQLLPLSGSKPLLLETWNRVRVLAPPSRIWVVAPAALAGEIRRHLPRLHPDNLILEPSPRDTAPAIGLACATVARRDPNAVVGIFPTDHVIRDIDGFERAVLRAADRARGGALVCLGIRPDRPATGYGYLLCAKPPRGRAAVPVRRFVEKPDLARARRFLRSGRYLWNGGMFVWRAERLLDELQRTAPETAKAVHAFVDGRRGAWARTRKLSVDYAVMEHATGVEVVPLDAGWDDVGSWEAAARLRREAGLTDSADHLLLESPHSAVFGEGRFIALVDVPGVVIVDTPDALLVVSREGSEKVRGVVDELKRRRRKDLL